jgi:hypothetical protein
MVFFTIADQISKVQGYLLLGYLDPGTGSMLLQLSIAGLLSGAFFLKSSFALLRQKVHARLAQER